MQKQETVNRLQDVIVGLGEDIESYKSNIKDLEHTHAHTIANL